MILQKLLYIFSHAPYSHAQGQEGLDALFIGASFDQKVSALFVHDGVFQLLQNQHVCTSTLKEYTKAFRALEDFGVERVYIHEPSLIARGYDVEELTIPAEKISTEAVTELIAQQFRVFTF